VSDRPATERPRAESARLARTARPPSHSQPDPEVGFLAYADPFDVEEAVRNFRAYLEILEEWDRREREEADGVETEG